MTDDAQEHASVRVWTELLARIRFGTAKVAGRTVRGATIKAVGYRLANFADSDGSRVRPGLSRIAVDLELDYSTAKRALQVLVRLGLLRLVRAGARPGHADEYRLTIPVDLLDREGVEVWSPARHQLEIERVRIRTRGRYRRSAAADPDPTDLQVSQAPAADETCRYRRHPQTPDLQVSQAPADTPGGDRPAGASGTDISRPAGASGTDLQVPEAPATYHRPRHTYDPPTDGGDVRTAVTGPRAREAEDADSTPDETDDTPAARPGRGCPTHGRAFAAGVRPDGQPACPLCRATGRRPPAGDSRPGLAPVIPIRSA